MLHFVISGQKKYHLVKTVDSVFAIELYSHYKFQKGGGKHCSSAICYFTYFCLYRFDKPDKNIDDNNNGVADDEEDDNPYGPNPENEEVGYTISGNIIWKDNNNKLGYRPEKVKIILYQNGKEFASGYVNMTKYGTYQFTGLPKYDNNMNPYTYTVKQEFKSTYLTWDSSLRKYVTANAYSTTTDCYDFINTFITPNEPVIEVKPDHVNTLFLKLAFNESIDWDMFNSNKEKESITIQFKELMKSYDANGNVSYSSDYSGMTYNTFLTSKGCTISGIPSGKYEIIVSDSSVLNLDNIKLGNSSNMSIVKESGNYYLIINDSNTNNSGIVTFNYNADGFFGYNIISKLYNLFKMN